MNKKSMAGIIFALLVASVGTASVGSAGTFLLLPCVFANISICWEHLIDSLNGIRSGDEFACIGKV